MNRCTRPRCERPALAHWWQLCVECSRPVLALGETAPRSDVDQRMAAGWDALDWAERIAPECWGNAAERDSWVLSVRCLAVAAVVTGRSTGCPHTISAAAAVPVVAVARIPGVLRCPPCAEPIVAQSATMGPECDRCGARSESASERVAALTGSSLIVVAQLCRGCRSRVFELVDDAGAS
jgi:hypothetical protein